MAAIRMNDAGKLTVANERAMVTLAGNPVLSIPNGKRLDAALDKVDFMVSIDIYINETTRHADVILPPCWGLADDHSTVSSTAGTMLRLTCRSMS